ncbi:MAG: DegV family protein [Coprothermobacterota bacterium]|nr:DegV family protein [Coprothermobacterota bacterium]
MSVPPVRIVTDSTAALPAALRTAYPEIAVIPLTVHFGPDSYREGIDLEAAAFYSLLATSPHHPTTSQPSPGDFLAPSTNLSWGRVTRWFQCTSPPFSPARWPRPKLPVSWPAVR